MAEPDTAGRGSSGEPDRAPTGGPSSRAKTLADFERSLAPMRAASAAMDRNLAPMRAIQAGIEKRQRQIQVMVDGGIGLLIREIIGDSDPDGADTPTIRGPSPQPIDRPARGPNGPIDVAVGNHPPRHLATSPIVDVSSFPPQVIDQIADLVRTRMATPSEPGPVASSSPQRRGRKKREISVGGVDAALEALAEEDPSVRLLSARDLSKRVPYGYRCISDSATYKKWRKDLKDMRREAKAEGVAAALEAGILQVRAKKPGRGRLKQPTSSRELEAISRALLSKGERLSDKEREQLEETARRRLATADERLDGQ